MALYDISAKAAGLPLYRFLAGKETKDLPTDLTIGIAEPQKMAEQAIRFVSQGVQMIKVKLGKNANEDIDRVRLIREAVGEGIILRIDANQGWEPADAKKALLAMEAYHVQFCEQPMRTYNDHLLPELVEAVGIPIMADESVYDHYDAERMIRTNSCSYVNIKLAKSGGIHEALAINKICAAAGIPCMMGGMLESRLALTAFAHLATACDNIIFYDMDTCLLGHLEDPVIGGVSYNQYNVVLPNSNNIGIGADINPSFLENCQSVTI